MVEGFEALRDGDSRVTAMAVVPRAHRSRSPAVTATVRVCPGQRLSFAAMLGATNDGFVAARSLYLPEQDGEERTAELFAYDAGSEANTESCEHVPCSTHGRRMTDGAEGVVARHAGIRGNVDVPRSRAWESEVLGTVTLRAAAQSQ